MFPKQVHESPVQEHGEQQVHQRRLRRPVAVLEDEEIIGGDLGRRLGQISSPPPTYSDKNCMYSP